MAASSNRPPLAVVPQTGSAYVPPVTGAAAVSQYGSGSGGGGMDAWQTTVETRLGQLHADVNQVRTDLGAEISSLSDRVDSNFKWLLGAYGVGFVSLAGMMITGYLKLADAIAALPH